MLMTFAFKFQISIITYKIRNVTSLITGLLKTDSGYLTIPARNQPRTIDSVAFYFKNSFALTTIPTVGQFRLLNFPPNSLGALFIKFLRNYFLPFKSVIGPWIIISSIKVFGSSTTSTVFNSISALSTTKSLPESCTSMNLDGIRIKLVFYFEICFKAFLLLAVLFLLAGNSGSFCSLLPLFQLLNQKGHLQNSSSYFSTLSILHNFFSTR
jgi:hypothetical protein